MKDSDPAALDGRTPPKRAGTAGARILFLSDTHLGFDMPFRPRVERRRRGPDFFANYERALHTAYEGNVDCVIHGGDILYRSRVPAELVEMAFRPLKRLADEGVPIYVIPGNHERSGIPRGLLANHPRIFVFDRPRTYVLTVDGYRLALAGLPFVREQARRRFPGLLESTDWRKCRADGYLLCLHQAIEGAKVGPADYTFRNGSDVIRASDIPRGFAAVISGHIHRFQVLTRDLRGRRLPAPVFYSGSIERTSFAEKDEKKGFLILSIETSGPGKSVLQRWEFRELPARPMVQVDFRLDGATAGDLKTSIATVLDGLPPDGVIGIRIRGTLGRETPLELTAEWLRSIAPPTMNVTVRALD